MTEQHWKCTKCGEEKPLTFEFFYREKRVKRGFASTCRLCNNKRFAVNQRTYSKTEKGRATAKAYRQRPEVKAKNRERTKAYQKANPKKVVESVRKSVMKRRAKLPNLVYGIECLSTGRLYVGCTRQTLGNRFRAHRSALRRNKHYNKEMQQDWNEFGEDSFRNFVLREIPNISEPEAFETEVIEELLSEGKYLYNQNKLWRKND